MLIMLIMLREHLLRLLFGDLQGMSGLRSTVNFKIYHYDYEKELFQMIQIAMST